MIYFVMMDRHKYSSELFKKKRLQGAYPIEDVNP
jgi:hypothetical protein